MLAYLEPGQLTQEEVLEAFCRDVEYLAGEFGDREESEPLTLLAVVLGVILVLVLLVLGCVCLSTVLCWCCFDACRRKVKYFR